MTPAAHWTADELARRALLEQEVAQAVTLGSTVSRVEAEMDAILSNLAKTDERLQLALASLRLAQYAAENRGMDEPAERLRGLGNDIAAAYIEMQALAGELLAAGDA